MKMTIRKAKKEDGRRITEIHKDCILKINSRFYSNDEIIKWISCIKVKYFLNQLKNSDWIVCERNNKIIGFAQYSVEDGWLYQIQIDPSLQGIGVGRFIYRFIEDKFKIKKKKEIKLYSTLNAVNFYKKLGFKKIDLITTNDGIKEVEMSKNFNFKNN